MFLTYGDLAKLFPNKRGIQEHELYFHTVASNSSVFQPKGVFIPFEEGSGKLGQAIENGAIAALWDESEDIPAYTPNHFPIFITNDLLKGLKDMMELYIENINNVEQTQKEVTNFLFLDEVRLKESTATYDIAVMADKISTVKERLQSGKEGAK
jgi:UDP-N-acetylmuramyl pentapeptide synthase